MPYAQVVSAYKRYKVSVNVNSVPDSPTMFSRRVFELLACGTAVISSYSIGIEQLLGADVVLMSDSEETTRALLEKVLSNDTYREQLCLRGLRKVFGEHTYTQRLQTILDAAGLARPAVGQPTLTMIAAVANAQEAAGAWENYRRQSYPRKRLLLCATDAASVRDVERLTGGDRSVSVQVAAGAHWGRALSAAVGAASEYVVALHPQHHYGPHFLTDYAHATLYVTEPAIGKASYFQSQDPDGLKVIGA